MSAFRYQLRERLADGSLWKQDLKEAAEGPCPTHPSVWARDHEAMGAVLAGMSGVSPGCARWAVDPDNGDKLIVGCILTRMPRFSGQFNAAKVREFVALGYLEKDPFK